MQINTNRKHSINGSNGFILFPSLADQGESPLIDNIHTHTQTYNMSPSRSWPETLNLSSSWLLGFLLSPVAGSWVYKPLRLAVTHTPLCACTRTHACADALWILQELAMDIQSIR